MSLIKHTGCNRARNIEVSDDEEQQGRSIRSDDPPDLEEPLEVVDLAERHGDEDEGLEEGPHDDARVGVLIDGAVDAVAHSHVLLLVLHA